MIDDENGNMSNDYDDDEVVDNNVNGYDVANHQGRCW